jgi:hypothetical protein
MLLLGAAGAAQGMPAASAALPATPSEEAAIREFRGRAYPICLGINPLVARDGTVNENAIDQCWCAVDQTIAEGRIDDLRRLDRGNARSLLGPALDQCRDGTAKGPAARIMSDEAIEDMIDDARDRVAEAVARANAVEEAAANGSKPQRAAPSAAAQEAPARLAWPGLPGWALWLLPVLAAAVGLVLLLARRRGGRGDLVRPPPSLRSRLGSGPPNPR